MKALVQDSYVSAEGVVHIEEIDMPVVETDMAALTQEDLDAAAHSLNNR